jgi:Clp amino terminal domain, pathogenicity island component
MFERYTEKGRRVIFFARYEASEFGSPYIETEHLLLELFREDKALTNRFLPSVGDSVESIRQRVRAVTPVREKLPTSVDLPLSHESKRVLTYAAEEAERLSHQHIGTEHLLLGLLREENCLAATMLRDRGLRIGPVRQKLVAHGAESSAGDLLASKLLTYLSCLSNELRINGSGPRIYVSPNSLRMAAPFLCIEILSPADRFGEVRQRIEERLAIGLRYVWLLDPVTHHVYIATPAAGLQEFKGDILRTENPPFELPLAQVFA